MLTINGEVVTINGEAITKIPYGTKIELNENGLIVLSEDGKINIGV